MEWIILFATLILLGISFILFQKLDQFLDRSSSKAANSTKRPSVLVFGSSEIAEHLIPMLLKYQIDYQHVEDQNEIDRTKAYSHLFAVSNNDLSNLLVNSILSRRGIVYKNIAICNDGYNQIIFQQNNIRCVSAAEITAEELFHTLFPNLI